MKGLSLIGVIFALFASLAHGSSNQAFGFTFTPTEHEQWLKMLYVGQSIDEHTYRPRVLDASFYLGDPDLINPQQELLIFVQRVMSGPQSLSNDYIICRFPGRFLFLNRVLELGYAPAIVDDCPAFSRWAAFDQYDTLSVVMVDGYFGNPASTFGHLILRHGNADGSRQLLDTTINYGARVPPGDGTLTYIAKGLTGQYDAYFSREEYYRQDLVYTQTEHRDMWVHQLDLTDEERRFFLAHIWELTGSPTRYYFLKNNCAYAVAEVLGIVLGVTLLQPNTLWYPPVTLFHDLERLNAQSTRRIFKSTRFVPSQKRTMAALLSQLDEQQKHAVVQYIEDAEANLANALEGLTMHERSAAIEAMIDYYGYVIDGYPELGTELYKRREQLIIARLGYPAGRQAIRPEIAHRMNPGRTARVSQLNIALLARSSLGGKIGLTPFSIKPTELGNDNFSEFTALHIEADYSMNSGRDHLDWRATLLRVAQRSDIRAALPSEWPWSWTINMGWESPSQWVYQSGFQGQVEAGQSVQVGALMLTGLAVLEQSGWASGIGLATEAGVRFTPQIAMNGRFGVTRYWEGYQQQANLAGQYGFSPELSSMVELVYVEKATGSLWQGSLGINWHFR